MGLNVLERFGNEFCDVCTGTENFNSFFDSLGCGRFFDSEGVQGLDRFALVRGEECGLFTAFHGRKGYRLVLQIQNEHLGGLFTDALDFAEGRFIAPGDDRKEVSRGNARKNARTTRCVSRVISEPSAGKRSPVRAEIWTP